MARDLSQLQKNGDATHYKVASSWTIQDLSQYFGTDWNLALKTTDNSVILANDTNGYLYQNLINDNQTDYSFFFFPLKNEIKLLKIKIDARCESYNQGTGYFGSDLCSMGVLLNNSQQSGSPNQRVITWTKTTASTVDDIKLEVDDTDWHTYERTLSTPIVGDYFGFFMLKGIWRVKNIELTIPETSNGGGATHIAKVTGQLKDLSSNLSDILMVSGGGGGGLIVGETAYTGKEAGGISGSGDNSADQSTGNAFGLGESGTNLSGGGSGLYGGYKGTSSKSGGAGSGYIGNSLLSNKKMVGYNVPTSSATGTKTESVEVYDSNYVANKPKAGNGHARIKFLREPGRKVQTLIDSSQGIKDSIFDNIVTIPNNDYGNDTWQFDQNGVLFINERNSNRASVNAKFLKGNATKLYIETSYEHRNTYGSNYRWQFVFLDNLYEGQHTPPSFLARTYFVLHTNQYNIIDNDPWYDLPSTVIELSLNDIPSNQRFYISFTSCDGHTEITKMYFDDDAYILE